MCTIIFIAARSNRETDATKHIHGHVDHNIYFLKMELGVLEGGGVFRILETENDWNYFMSGFSPYKASDRACCFMSKWFCDTLFVLRWLLHGADGSNDSICPFICKRKLLFFVLNPRRVPVYARSKDRKYFGVKQTDLRGVRIIPAAAHPWLCPCRVAFAVLRCTSNCNSHPNKIQKSILCFWILSTRRKWIHNSCPLSHVPVCDECRVEKVCPFFLENGKSRL